MKFKQIRSATSIVTFGSKRFLIDPMLAQQGAYPEVPFTTSTGRGNPDCPLPCSVESLFEVDACIVTHLHFDHFDEVAIKGLPRALPLFCQSEDDASVLKGYGFSDVRVLTEQGLDFGGVTLYRTSCDHGASCLVTQHFYRKAGFGPEACGVVFESALEPERFYLAGDTIYSVEVNEALARFTPALIAVNAAGAQYPQGHLLIMNQYDVMALMEAYPELEVIATHVEGVSHATVNRPMLRAFAAEHGLTKLHVPDDGQELSFF